MTELEQLREELKAEKLRVSALSTLVASLEKERDHYLKQYDSLVRSKLELRAETLESERKANELLTNEVEALQQLVKELRRDGLRSHLG